MKKLLVLVMFLGFVQGCAVYPNHYSGGYGGYRGYSTYPSYAYAYQPHGGYGRGGHHEGGGYRDGRGGQHNGWGGGHQRGQNGYGGYQRGYQGGGYGGDHRHGGYR